MQLYLVTFFFSIFGVQFPTDVPQDAPPPVAWTCQPAQWLKDPGFNDDGLYEGTIGSDCEFTGIQLGGFPHLDQHLLERLTTSPEVKQVNSGPTQETYANMPSVYYDVTIVSKFGSDSVTIRNDNHVATDMTDHLVFATASKDVQGEGYGQYLKKLDIDASVDSTATAHHYVSKVAGHFLLDKPWYAPSDVFASKVNEKIMGQMPKIEEKVIREMAENI